MAKNLIIISVVLLVTAFTVFSGCEGVSRDTTSTASESIMTAAETTIQEETKPEATTGQTAIVVLSITPEEVHEIISKGKKHFLLDVRTPEEFREGYIEGATLIPVSELESRLDELPRDKKIIIYCRSGNRSMTAANILINNGFDMVYDMGGIADWQAKGYPVIIEEAKDS